MFVYRSNKGWKSSSILLIAIVIVYLVTNTPRLLLNLAEYLRQVCVGILAFIRMKYFPFLPSNYSISVNRYSWMEDTNAKNAKIKVQMILKPRKSCPGALAHRNGWCRKFYHSPDSSSSKRLVSICTLLTLTFTFFIILSCLIFDEHHHDCAFFQFAYWNQPP